MNERARTNSELIEEISVLRQRMQELEQSERRRQRAEEALKGSEELFHLIVDNARDVIWMLDMNLQFTYLSPAIEQLLGYTVEEYLAKPHSDIILPDSLALIYKVFEEELAAENEPNRDPYRSRTLEIEDIHKNGSRIWAELKMNFSRDAEGKAIGILGFERDITERKRAAEALRESEERFRALSENALDIIYTMDLRGAITYANPAWTRILGHESEELLGRYFTDFAKEEDKKTYRRLFKTIRDGVNNVRNYIGIMPAKNGTERVLIMNSAYNRDSQGRILGVVGSMKDITEQREMEKKLSQAQKLESIGTLAGGIAHDFNNLLMGIQGYASLMLLDMEPSHPHYKYLKRIEEQVLSGADLTRQLLGFARGGRYEVKPAEINDILDKTSSLFLRTKKEITIQRKYGKDLWTVEVDPGQMEQVFLNLFVNAWQAMPGGGVIYLETQNVVLDEAVALSYDVPPGKYVKIIVTDTGTGMDAKTKERIFDPFFTTKEMGRGAGLGLATVYGIIKGHGGLIQVDSEPGCGTVFTIYLPASEKAAVPEKTAAQTIACGTETILVVDDEPMVAEVTKALLEYLGYRVDAAGSGREAIDLYREKRNEIELVILDMIMPELSGGKTYNLLKEINPEIRVLLSSGYSIDGEAQHILNRGCNGFIQKPFQLEKLSRSVREALA